MWWCQPSPPRRFRSPIRNVENCSAWRVRRRSHIARLSKHEHCSGQLRVSATRRSRAVRRWTQMPSGDGVRALLRRGSMGSASSPKAAGASRRCRQGPWPRWCGSHSTRSPLMARRTGRRGHSLAGSASARMLWPESGRTTTSSRGESTPSRSPTTRTSNRSWSTSSACT